VHVLTVQGTKTCTVTLTSWSLNFVWHFRLSFICNLVSYNVETFTYNREKVINYKHSNILFLM